MSARAFARRWNRRVLRRDWRQYLIILALMITAATLAIGGVLAAHNLTAPPAGEYGGGRFAAWTDDDPAALSAALEAGGHPFGVIESTTVSVTGTAQRVDVRALDPANPATAPLVDLVAGRLPSRPDELAVTDRAVVDIGVGATTTLGGRQAAVVGLVENPTDLADEFVLAPSVDSFGAAEIATRFLVDADPAVVTFPGVDGVGTSSAGPPIRTVTTILVVVLAAFGMIEIGLLASVGFAVITGRLTRQYGLLAAVGATPRTLRSVATGTGVLLGVLAAACGGVLAIGATWSVLPHMEAAIGHRIDFAIPWWAVVVNAVMVVAVAAVAARWPARPLATRPVADLLGVRRPIAPSSTRSAVVGAIIAPIGAIALAVGFARVEVASVLVGVLLTPVGLLLLTPLLVRSVASVAGMLPLATRMAGRAVDRHRRRSAAVVAALGLSLAIPTAIVLVTASIDARDVDDGPNLPEHTLAVWQPGAADGGTRIPTAMDDDAPSAVAARIADAAPDLRLTPVEVAVAPDAPRELWEFDGIGPQLSIQPLLAGRRGTGQCLSCDVHIFDDGDGNESSWLVEDTWIATPELLDVLEIDPGPGGAAIVARDDELRAISTRGPLEEDRPASVVDRWPRFDRVPPMLVTTDAVRDGGFTRVTIGTLVSSDEPITAETRALVRNVVGPDAVLEFHEASASRSIVRGLALGVGIVLGVGLALAALALLMVELESDLRTLEAVGAPPGTTRRLAAAVAALIAVSGAILALVMGYAALIPLLAVRETHFPFVVPLASLAVVLVAFPALAGAAGYAARALTQWTRSRTAPSPA